MSRIHLMENTFKTPLQPAFTLMPLDEMVRRIENIRAEEAPDDCPTCGTVNVLTGSRRCGLCRQVKSLDRFNHRSGRPFGSGYRSRCKDCDSRSFKQRRSDLAIRAIRRAS